MLEGWFPTTPLDTAVQENKYKNKSSRIHNHKSIGVPLTLKTFTCIIVIVAVLIYIQIFELQFLRTDNLFLNY